MGLRRWVTTILVAVVLLAFVLLAWERFPREAVVNWADVHQVIDGFGGSCADFYKPLPPQMMDFFFTTAGIGLSLLRIKVVPSAADCKAFFGKDGGECVEVNAGATILKGELAIAQQAVARGITVWSTPWSPPAFMKSNGSFTHGGSLLPLDYAPWAESLAGYVKLLVANGVPIYALSVQNEPELATDYGSALFSAREVHDFVPYLHSALASAGEGNTKIMIAESATWNFSLVKDAMTDSAVARDVGILAAHGYGPMKITAPPNYGKHVWQSEDSSQSSVYDGSMSDALAWAEKIHSYLTIANVNAWNWWFLSDAPQYGGGTDNSALTDILQHYPKRTYMTGQWSKFVRPGWHRIGVSYSRPLEIGAFKDPADHAFAIVVINPSPLPISQTFVLNGFTTNSVTTWVTSSKLSLASQGPRPVSADRITCDLPAKSVVTLAGVASPRKQ